MRPNNLFYKHRARIGVLAKEGSPHCAKPTPVATAWGKATKRLPNEQLSHLISHRSDDAE